MKGTLLSVVVDLARSEAATAPSTLSAESRKALDGVVLASVWYPLDVLGELLAWLETRKGPGIHRHAGTASAERDLSGVYRSFLRTADPAATLAALPVIWSLYHDSGSALVERLAPGSVDITVRAFAQPQRALCELTVGWLQAAAVRSGGPDVRVVEGHCRLRHDDRCRYTVAWAPTAPPAPGWAR